MKKVDRYKKSLLQGASSFLVVSFAVANGAAALAATVTVPSASGTLLNTANASGGADQAKKNSGKETECCTHRESGQCRGERLIGRLNKRSVEQSRPK